FLEEECADEYFLKLKSEYQFLKTKYSLTATLHKHQWKFLRLRPANFPTLRIAEFAAFISTASGIFSMFLESDSKNIKQTLRSKPTAYWQSHYRFGESTEKKISGLGESGAQLICINTVVPILAAYSYHIDDSHYLDKAIAHLQGLKIESNSIISKMKAAGFEADNAFDSQGLIELHNNYCLKKRCLQCNVGASLVRP
ncbi:DUF2851 family protein, partial [Fulvivirga sp. RKSG066]|uniref:DUF2851 family protein n=1 Tax=Fulvivirga aurantia TaxID=2529383 RepID=UPI0012BC655B